MTNERRTRLTAAMAAALGIAGCADESGLDRASVEKLATAAAPFATEQRIEAEDYLPGGEGIGYHDSTPANLGGTYRQDGVDILAWRTASAGHVVGWTSAGEWLAYDVEVAATERYALVLRVATTSPSTSTRRIRVEVDGAPVGVATFDATAARDAWIEVPVAELELGAGAHRVRLIVEGGSISLDAFSLRPPCGRVSELLVPSCGAWLGAFSNDHGVSGFENLMAEHERRIGRRLDVVHGFHPAGTLPMNAAEAARARAGQILFLNWKPAARWADAAGGDRDVDARIVQAAQRIADVPHRVMLTIFHEPENDVGEAGSEADYVAMWHNVRAIFDAEGVRNVVWVWDMQLLLRPEDDVLALYPGDAYVDWIMWNPYSTDGRTSFAARVRPAYDWLVAHSAPGHDFVSKPWGLGEWGVNARSAPGGAFEQRYYTEAGQHLADFHRLKAFVVFDADGTLSTRVDDTVAEQESYNALTRLPYLNQPLVLPPLP